jgi:hypothetical protein
MSLRSGIRFAEKDMRQHASGNHDAQSIDRRPGDTAGQHGAIQRAQPAKLKFS